MQNTVFFSLCTSSPEDKVKVSFHLALTFALPPEEELWFINWLLFIVLHEIYCTPRGFCFANTFPPTTISFRKIEDNREQCSFRKISHRTNSSLPTTSHRNEPTRGTTLIFEIPNLKRPSINYRHFTSHSSEPPPPQLPGRSNAKHSTYITQTR